MGSLLVVCVPACGIGSSTFPPFVATSSCARFSSRFSSLGGLEKEIIVNSENSCSSYHHIGVSVFGLETDAFHFSIPSFASWKRFGVSICFFVSLSLLFASRIRFWVVLAGRFLRSCLVHIRFLLGVSCLMCSVLVFVQVSYVVRVRVVRLDIVGILGIPPGLVSGRMFVLVVGIRSGLFGGLASMGRILWQLLGNLFLRLGRFSVLCVPWALCVLFWRFLHQSLFSSAIAIRDDLSAASVSWWVLFCIASDSLIFFLLLYFVPWYVRASWGYRRCPRAILSGRVHWQRK